MNTRFSDEERIERIWNIEQIKELMYRRSYYITWDMRKEELRDLWVSEPQKLSTASYGSNWGWYVGMDSIRAWYVDEHEKILDRQAAANGTRKNVGNLYAHPVSTGVVELAEDGHTAKGLWYSIGQETIANDNGTATANWIVGKIAVDFWRENESWKIWHLIFSLDLSCEAGKDYRESPVYEDWSDHSSNVVRKEFGKPTIEKLVHDVTFNWWDDYPPMPPKGYITFSNDISYGPEGHRYPFNRGFAAGEGRNWK